MNIKSFSLCKKIILKIILITLITSIIITNFNNYMNNYNKSWLVEVNNILIKKNKIQDLLVNKLNQIKSKNKEKYFKIIEHQNKIKNLYNKIISKEINNILIENYLNKLNITNKRKNIENLISKLDIFKTKNKFNKTKYIKFLAENNLTEQEYLKILNDNLVQNYFLNDIINSEFLLKNEKKLNYKKKSKIIFYKKALLNFKKLVSKQKVSNKEILNFYNKNKNFFVFHRKFKLKFLDLSQLSKKYYNDKKKYFKILNIQKQINNLSINKKNYFNLIEKISKIKSNQTKWFTIKKIPKQINFKKIINFLKMQKYYKIDKKKNYINYHLQDKNKNFYIQIIGFKKEKNKSFKNSKKQIKHLLKINKAKIKAYKKLKKIERELNKQSFKTFNNEKLKFKKKIYNTKKKKKKFLKDINPFNKKFNNKKPIYVKITDYKKKWIILKLFKKKYIKMNKNKKNNLDIRSKLLNQKLLMNLILKNLRSKSKIKYNNKYLIFKKKSKNKNLLLKKF
ncbi:MAG: hypothetical protein G8D27_01310 [Buchnera aphidicola (Periphyllus aceris)]|nr:hypothetical protein [Buchnera aphidicola (Periphyllus aceris)]